MTKIIAIANHKGGVGKTTTVASVGSILASRGKRVLLIDLDAQANLTTSFINGEPQQTIYNAMKGEQTNIVKLSDNLSILPSSLDMAGIELEISARVQREFILKDIIEPVESSYDYILLDCPPSLGLVTINAMVAAHEVYIPLTPEALPTKGLTMLLEIISMVKKRLNPSLVHSGIIITRWERNKLSQNVAEGLESRFGNKVFSTRIRKNVSLAEAPLMFQDITTYAPNSNGAEDYRSLTDEILERSGDGEPQQ